MSEVPIGADPAFRNSKFVVIDFETVTPQGYSPEPIEVAYVALQITDTSGTCSWRVDETTWLTEVGRDTRYIKPPAHAPLTTFDTHQTGISPAALEQAGSASTVLSAVDGAVGGLPTPILVAHNASVERNVLELYESAAPRLSKAVFLDTVRLSKDVNPHRTSHSLDSLITDFGIAMEARRHTALGDVLATVELFATLLGRSKFRSRMHLLGSTQLPLRSPEPTAGVGETLF